MNKHTAEQPYPDEMQETTERSKGGHTVALALLFGTALLAGCVHLFYQHPLLEPAQWSGFLILGFVYVRLRTGYWPATDGHEAFTDAVYFVLVLVLALGAFTFFAGAFQWQNLLLCGGAFLLPATVAEAARLYDQLSASPKPVWQYAKDIPDEPPFVYLEKKPVLFHLKTAGGAGQYPSQAPRSFPLGLAFFYAVKAAETGDNWRPFFIAPYRKPHRWVFYTQRFGLKIYLNPYETIFENRIRSNSVIVAERLDAPQPIDEF